MALYITLAVIAGIGGVTVWKWESFCWNVIAPLVLAPLLNRTQRPPRSSRFITLRQPGTRPGAPRKR